MTKLEINSIEFKMEMPASTRRYLYRKDLDENDEFIDDEEEEEIPGNLL